MAEEAKQVTMELVETTAAVEDELTGVPEGWLGIAEAATVTGYTAQYVRQMVLKGKVPAVKMNTGSYNKWFVDVAWLTAHKSNTVRSGLRRYLLKIDSENEDVVRSALDEIGIEYSLELAYKPKTEAETETEADSEAVLDDVEFGS